MFKGLTQTQADARMEEWRAKKGPLDKALRAYRKKWHPDRRKSEKGKANAEIRFKAGETAAEHLLRIQVRVRPPRPKVAPHQHPYAQPGSRTPPPPMAKRGRNGVAQATGVPPNVPVDSRGIPLGVPRSPQGLAHGQRHYNPPPAPTMRGFRVVQMHFGHSTGGFPMDGLPAGMAGLGGTVNMDDVLNSIFGDLLGPEQPRAPRGRRGFKLPY